MHRGNWDVMHKLIGKALLFASLLLSLAPSAWGGELAGLWQEFDDRTGKVEALVRIDKLPDGSYEGRIVKLMADVVGDTGKVCGNCSGALHNQPWLGMRILYGMKRKDGQTFEGGEIVDPDEGKVYRCRMKLSEDGSTLEVTGFIGISWFGQSETWKRAE
jgi:uncharacterized protein (DUF2147 family)